MTIDDTILLQYLDGQLPAARAAAVQAAVQADRELAQRLLELAEHEALLREVVGVRAEAERLSPPARAKRPVLLWLAAAGAAAAAVFAVWFGFLPSQEANGLQVEIVSVAGPAADVAERQESLPAQPGMALGPGAVVTTGPKTQVQLRYADGSTVAVSGGSRLTVQRSGDSKELYVAYGKLLVTAAKQAPDAPLCVVTPNGRVTVLGTRFTVDVTPTKTTVEVESGAVRVLRGEQSVKVPAGHFVAAGQRNELVALPVEQCASRLSPPLPQPPPTAAKARRKRHKPKSRARVVRGTIHWVDPDARVVTVESENGMVLCELAGDVMIHLQGAILGPIEPGLRVECALTGKGGKQLVRRMVVRRPRALPGTDQIPHGTMDHDSGKKRPPKPPWPEIE